MSSTRCGEEVRGLEAGGEKEGSSRDVGCSYKSAAAEHRYLSGATELRHYLHPAN